MEITSKKFHCNKCQKKMPNLNDMKVHLETHLPGNFACNKCQAMGINTNSLRKHNTNHHLAPKTKSNRFRMKKTSIQKRMQYGDKCLGCPIPDCKRCDNCRDKTTDGGQIDFS